MKDALLELLDFMSWVLVIIIVYVFMSNTIDNIQGMNVNDAVINFTFTTTLCVVGLVQYTRLFTAYLATPSYDERQKRIQRRAGR
jgi:hypothetical protein